MEYAVVFQSKNGNTRKIAEEIYDSISVETKVLHDLDDSPDIPSADVYFIGFGMHGGACSMDIIRCFEQIEGGYFAVFVTGIFAYPGNEKYRAALAWSLDVWMPENADYLGMYICQGKVDETERIRMFDKMKMDRDILEKIIKIGESHPDDEDLSGAAAFAVGVQEKAESGRNLSGRERNEW